MNDNPRSRDPLTFLAGGGAMGKLMRATDWSTGHTVWGRRTDIWHILQPLIDNPLAGAPVTWMTDIPPGISRHGFVEETPPEPLLAEVSR